MTTGKRAKKYGWNLDHSYANLPQSFYTILDPVPVRAPELIIFNQPLAKSLGLDNQALQGAGGAAIFAGNQIPAGAQPLAQAYAGHQFGHFTMLGDGRAHLLGEQITPQGERFDIQLKGSGITPYSRSGDGRAPLGPMLREYIISEAMYALGIPTTRSLAVVSTGQQVVRESYLAGAILTRVAASHLRVGTFEYVSQWGHLEELKILADYTLQRHFPGFDAAGDKYLYLLQQVIKRQAVLVAKWMLVGFIHGVMNTDNMALSGETIDYGPCAFMDVYDPATVFSSIDAHGRYAYANQPGIAAWNLARFADSLLPLLHDDQKKAIKIAEDVLSDFAELYHSHWLGGMRSKLGIFNEEARDESLVGGLLDLMRKYQADYTNTFIALTFDYVVKDQMKEELAQGNRAEEIPLLGSAEFAEWHQLWQNRLGRQKEAATVSQQLMRNSNPALIPRNHRVEEALEAAVEEEDYGVMESLLDVLSNPYAHSPAQIDYAALPAPSECPYRTFCGT